MFGLENIIAAMVGCIKSGRWLSTVRAIASVSDGPGAVSVECHRGIHVGQIERGSCDANIQPVFCVERKEPHGRPVMKRHVSPKGSFPRTDPVPAKWDSIAA